MRKHEKVARVLALVCGLALGGCSPVTMQLPYVADYALTEDQLGTWVEGTDCTGVAFGGHVREVTLDRAIEVALDGRGSALADVTIETRSTETWIVGEYCLRVRGRLIR